MSVMPVQTFRADHLNPTEFRQLEVVGQPTPDGTTALHESNLAISMLVVNTAMPAQKIVLRR